MVFFKIIKNDKSLISKLNRNYLDAEITVSIFPDLTIDLSVVFPTK